MAVSGPSQVSGVIDGTTQKASSASQTWDALNLPAQTLTLTGTTQVTTATGLNLASLRAPTITDTSAVTVDVAATLYVGGPPVAGGSVTLTAPLALWVDSGITRLDGQVGIRCSASPVAALEIITDTDTNNGAQSGVFDTKYVTIGNAGGSAGPGLSFSYRTSTNTAFISSVQPGTAFRALTIQALPMTLLVPSGLLTLGSSNSNLTFFSGLGTAKATVSGAKGSNAALASLMTALSGYGLVTDSTSA